MYKNISKRIKFNKNIILSEKSKVFIVAEISGNHSGKIENVLKSIDQIKKAGADAVKIQSYEPNTITVNSRKNFFFINDKSIWKGQYLYDLYKSSYTPFSWHKKIFSYAKSKKLFCFSSPFDLSSLKILEKNNCPIYKIASPEIQDLELIRSVAKTRKPIIISTGIADNRDISLAIKECLKFHNNKIILLNCISSYPAKPNELNLKNILELKKFCPIVGFSDHSDGGLAAISSVSLGAKIVEKHFILNKKIKSADKKFSITGNDFYNFVKDIRLVEKMLGNQYVNKKDILKNKFTTITKSLFYKEDLKKGYRLKRENILSIRPGLGVSPQMLSKILGKKLKRNVKKDTPIQKKDI
jgi:pseudaminic acid synthase